jgi:hypothetical protein
MCDKELLLGYLYDDLAAGDRAAFDAHLATCADCRDEVSALRQTRASLTSWAPPEPDLGFHIVRSSTPASSRTARWRLSPAWGLAAAAALTLAVSAAVANLEIRVGAGGVVVRTGWGPSPAAADTPALQASTAALQKVEARVKELESQLAARPATAATVTGPAVPVNRMTDADIVRLVRQLVSDSEQRQQDVLARQILQVSRDTEVARRNDLDRMLTAYRQLQGASYETSQRLRGVEDHIVRVGLQR